MMNNAKKIIPNKIYNGNNPEDVKKFIESMGIKIPEGMNVTTIASPLEEAKPEEVDQPKYVPNKPAVTFDNVTLYCYDDNASGSNTVRSCFCDIADRYNFELSKIPADTAFLCRKDTVRTASDNADTISITIVSSFIQAASNLFWSLAKSVNDLAGNYGVKPYNFDDYSINDYIKYDINDIICDVFRKAPKEIEDIVNSGLFHLYIASAINNYGESVHNTFACRVIPRMIPYMTAKDAENFYKGFNLLFRMFMGDLNYEACVLETALLSGENPNVLIDNFNIADSVFNNSKLKETSDNEFEL